MKNIYVGNLPFNVTADELRSLFTGYGQVTSVGLPHDRYSGEGRGSGFVEMPNDEEARKAISELNGTKLRGRILVVNEARRRPDRRAG